MRSSGEILVGSVAGIGLGTRRGNGSHRIVVGIAYAGGVALVSRWGLLPSLGCWQALLALELTLVVGDLSETTQVCMGPGNNLMGCSRCINSLGRVYYRYTFNKMLLRKSQNI